MANKPNVVLAAGNEYSSTLSAGITDSALSLTVADPTGLNSGGGYLIVDEGVTGKEEVIYYESLSGSVLTIATNGRGLGDTSAAAHDAGATITDILVADHINGIAGRFVVEHQDNGAHKQISSAIVQSGTSISSTNKAIDKAYWDAQLTGILATFASGEYTLANDKAYQGETSGAVAKTLIKMDPDDHHVLGALKRAGGSATDFDSGGTTVYTTDEWAMCVIATGNVTASSSLAVTLPITYANKPIAIVTPATSSDANMTVLVNSVSQVTVYNHFTSDRPAFLIVVGPV